MSGPPDGIGVIDLMIGVPSADQHANYDYLRKGLKEESRDAAMPADYMFHDLPPDSADGIATLLEGMDRHGIERGLANVSDRSVAMAATFPDRLSLGFEVTDPNDVMGSVTAVRRAYETHGIVAVSAFPAGPVPQVPVDDPKMYAIYTTCVELGLPAIVNAGIAGPRVPSSCQHVERFDQVCYDFPDLTLVMRHGAEPWEDLAVKLMIKWPGLHYMTSAFAPKYYPQAVLDYANSRGADKVMYAGYYPMALSLDRIFAELADVPLKDEVWPKFLRDNALRVFDLPGAPHG